MAADLKVADTSLKALKDQDKSLEKVYDLIATLECCLNHQEECTRIAETRVLDVENELFVVRACHNDLADKVRGMEGRLNWSTRHACCCVD